MRPRSMLFLLMLCLLTPVFPWGTAVADEPPSGRGAPAAVHEDVSLPPATVWHVHAAEPPSAVLRCRLLPPVWEQHRGNAAVMYTKRAIVLQGKAFNEVDEKLVHWLELPAEELPKSEIRTMVDSWHDLYQDLDIAARQTECDWNLPIGERNLITLILPEIQAARTMARLLAVKARLEVAEGKLDAALRTFQTGFALGQHVAKSPTLISGLVGIAISQTMFQALRDFIEHPRAPNLYWALTALPRPLIDLHTAMDVEAAMLYLSFPALRAIQMGDNPPRDWQATIDSLTTELLPLIGDQSGLTNRLTVTLAVLKAYPQAKQRLIERGRTAAEVEAMPAFEVVARDSLTTYDELRDQSLCWYYVPYWQAREHIKQSEAFLREEGRRRETIPLASLLSPAIHGVTLAAARADRQVAVLRTIEALRLHAAQHNGNFPAQLADIAAVPVPEDPLSGKSFEYRRQPDAAVLSTPATSDVREAQAAVNIQLRIVK